MLRPPRSDTEPRPPFHLCSGRDRGFVLHRVSVSYVMYGTLPLRVAPRGPGKTLLGYACIQAKTSRADAPLLRSTSEKNHRSESTRLVGMFWQSCSRCDPGFDLGQPHTMFGSLEVYPRMGMLHCRYMKEKEIQAKADGNVKRIKEKKPQLSLPSPR